MTVPDARASVTPDAAGVQHEIKIGLLLLSLDAVAAHAGLLGLGFREPGLVKDAVRCCAAWWADPRSNRAGPQTALVAAVRACLSQVGAAACAPRVFEWLDRFLFALSVEATTDAWGPVLTRYNAQYDSALRQLGIGDSSAATLGRISREYAAAADSADAVATSIEAAVYSPWDRAQFDEYRRESELIAPTDYLSAWLDAEAVLTALVQIADALQADEFRIFTEWAKAVAGVEFRIPESQLAVATLANTITAYKAARGRLHA